MVWAGPLLREIPGDLVSRYRSASSSWDRVKKRRGRRYENCKFANYSVVHELQRETVSKLAAYAAQGEQMFQDGVNVILFGPKGTGKDHLLMALAFDFITWSGRSVCWINGVDLMEDFQLSSLDKPTRHFSGSMDDTPAKCDVLWISDPLPPSGMLSDFQQRALFQLIDRRYSDMRPTWVSINVASGAEAESRMGAQVVDRLRHGALQCFCNWPSFRVESR